MRKCQFLIAFLIKKIISLNYCDTANNHDIVDTQKSHAK